jgi:hypothetical protein
MNIAFLIGRIIFATFWLMGSFNHFKNLNYMSEYAKARRVVPMSTSRSILGHSSGRWLEHGFGLAFCTGPTWCETQKQNAPTQPSLGALSRTALPEACSSHNLQ